MNTKYYHSLVSIAFSRKQPIVITGLRGCGKTAFLQEVIAALRGERPPVRIVSINPEESRWKDITNGWELTLALRGLGVGATAVCIDNADMIDGFEKIFEEITEEKDTRLIITGKKSGVILDRLRSVSAVNVMNIRIHPLGYSGFLKCREFTDTSERFHEYLETGGLPEMLKIPPEFSRRHLEKTCSAMILDEIIEPYNIRDTRQLRMLLSAMCTFTGIPVSNRTVCKWFAQRQMTIAPQTVLDFLHFCEESFLLIPIPMLDIAEDRIISGNKVWYFGDTGIRSVCRKYSRPENSPRNDSAEISQATENAVFLSLVDSGWSVVRGRIETNRKNTSDKITFVCEKEGKRVYMQALPSDCTEALKTNLENSLLAVRDGWEKQLIGTDPAPPDSSGIRTVSAGEILLQNP